MKRLKIVHTEASDAWGGQDIRVLNEALWFRGQGHSVHIFNPAHGEILKRAQALGLPSEAVSFAKRAKVADFLRLVRRFKVIKPDLVCTHSSVDSWVGLLAARFCKVPVAVRYRHVSTPVSDNFMNRWQYQSLCDHVVTTAASIRRNLCKTFGLQEHTVSSIPTGIDPPAMPHRSEAKSALLSRLGLPDKALLLGQVSVLRSWKGHLVLMDAFERLADRVPECYLLLVGGGPGMEHFSRRRKQSPVARRILMVGHQDDVWPFFRGLDVAVLCSTKNEGIPQAGLQAMFAGCPFVGTNVGGIPEIVHHEQTGLVVEPNDPEGLAKAIIRLLHHPELGNRMAELARNMARGEFTLESMGQKMESLFQALVASAKSKRP